MLYIYDVNNLGEMRKDMQNHRFCSISSIFYECENINDLLDKEYNFLVIDITNLVRDNNLSNLFSEKYLITLLNISDEIHFSLQSDMEVIFIQKYPDLIESDKFNHEYQSKHSNTDSNISINEPLTLLTYTDNITILNFISDEKVILLSNLIESENGFSLQYNLNNIEKILVSEELIYIDITSAIRSLKIREYWAFQLEILFKRIINIKKISFIIEETFKDTAMEIFPLLFENVESIHSDISNTIDEKEIIEEEKDYTEILNSMNSKLIGHERFKTDFKHNFSKFIFFNKMKQKMIFSILICGTSGVGKTEFAKIASKVMYPDDSLIKINFGNYSTEGVLNSLIGSPIGYIGSEEGGELINKISSSKSKIILIDEFEKATPSVYNFFYELLEDGKFTDRHGREHSLAGYMIVFTSNMTERQYKEHIPDSLKSRFDMTYKFEALTVEEKQKYINDTAKKIISDIHDAYNVNLQLNTFSTELDDLVKESNLRNMRRQIEDIVFTKFSEIHKLKPNQGNSD